MIIHMIRKRVCNIAHSMGIISRSTPLSYYSTNKPDPIPKYPPENQLKIALSAKNIQYDVAVIGGGSGGLAFSFQAKKLGLNTILFDFVSETPHGTKWGIGGTCVNVGCIPKKLMHQAALLGESIKNAYDYGWDLEINNPNNIDKLTSKFSWQKMVKIVNQYIRSLNFGYKSSLAKSQIKYQNGLATLMDKHTVLFSKDKSIIQQFLRTGVLPSDETKYGIIRAKNIVIATGTRPTYFSESQCKGSKLAITSDDIFWQKKPPGKTLIVGGGYVAVEIAGFLSELGFNVSMMTRGEYLRSFDRDMVKLIIQDLKLKKVNIIPTSLPVEIQKQNKQYIVKYKNVSNSEHTTQKYDTVLMAVGRTANTEYLNLNTIGISIDSSNKKIKTNKHQIQRTEIENIYAIGDVVHGVPQLTGTVQKAGLFLARRIAHQMGYKPMNQNQYKKSFIDFKDYPTTVFSPLQYSVCGLSQEQALSQLKQIEVYHSKIIPLEQSILNKYDEDGNDHKTRAYLKVITDKNGTVYGIHYAGPNAGEVMQGYAVAMRIGLTKQILDRTIGIHPTVSEEFTNIKITKASGEDPQKTGC